MIDVYSQPRARELRRFDELSKEDAEEIEKYFSLATESSITGMAFDRMALYRFTAERDREGNFIPRSFALPTEPVMSTDGKHRIGTRIASNLVHVGSEGPYGEPSYEPNREEVETRAFVSLRIKRMVLAGNSAAVEMLGIHFGAIGHYFAVGSINECTGRPVAELPRLYSLLHVVPSGRELLQQAPKPGVAPRWKDKTWAQLTALERSELKRDQQLLWTRMRARPADELMDLPEYGQMRIHAAELVARGKVRKDYRPHRQLFASAVEEAREAFRASCVAWNEAGRSGR